MVLTGFLPVLTSLREKTFCRTLNCLFDRLLRALIGGQAYERASSGNVIDCPPDVTGSIMATIVTVMGYLTW
jgi:hypothetical protein